ncbi:MAG: recombinase family protein [Gammaproteobacteria bacterium]|nr:recombinase family protein [Gammaproteobacteria bacterium]
MLVGYVRVSKTDGSQVLDMQLDAMKKAKVKSKNIYQDKASGKQDNRPGLEACLKALRPKDILVVWKLDRLGRSLNHLLQVIEDLTERKIGFRVLTGQGATIDTTTPSGKLVFGIFAALAEFERELIVERTKAGLAAARARGRVGGRRCQLSKSQVRYLQSAMKKRDTVVADLAEEMGVTRATLYRYVGPKGQLRVYGKKVLKT